MQDRIQDECEQIKEEKDDRIIDLACQKQVSQTKGVILKNNKKVVDSTQGPLITMQP